MNCPFGGFKSPKEVMIGRERIFRIPGRVDQSLAGTAAS